MINVLPANTSNVLPLTPMNGETFWTRDANGATKTFWTKDAQGDWVNPRGPVAFSTPLEQKYYAPNPAEGLRDHLASHSPPQQKQHLAGVLFPRIQGMEPGLTDTIMGRFILLTNEELVKL